MPAHTSSVAAAPAFRTAAIVCIIGFGLLLDQHFETWGQIITNIAVWMFFVAILLRAARLEQIGLIACVLYATIGEIFLSLVWGLYDYRLGNIPLFVPPGHALLFMLGMTLAARVTDRAAWAVPILAAPFVLWLAVTGIDTLGPPLLALLVLCMAFGPARKLYATMFVLALAMENLRHVARQLGMGAACALAGTRHREPATRGRRLLLCARPAGDCHRRCNSTPAPASRWPARCQRDPGSTLMRGRALEW
jgi:hypothetical protein